MSINGYDETMNRDNESMLDAMHSLTSTFPSEMNKMMRDMISIAASMLSKGGNHIGTDIRLWLETAPSRRESFAGLIPQGATDWTLREFNSDDIKDENVKHVVKHFEKAFKGSYYQWDWATMEQWIVLGILVRDSEISKTSHEYLAWRLRGNVGEDQTWANTIRASCICLDRSVKDTKYSKLVRRRRSKKGVLKDTYSIANDELNTALHNYVYSHPASILHMIRPEPLVSDEEQ
jgi:hypothetical protein